VCEKVWPRIKVAGVSDWLRRDGRLVTLSLQMSHASIKTTADLYGHLDLRDAAADLAHIEPAESIRTEVAEKMPVSRQNLD
jgi:integrase